MYLVAPKKAFSFQCFAGDVQKTQVIVAPFQHDPHGFSGQVRGLKQDMDRKITCALHIPSNTETCTSLLRLFTGKGGWFVNFEIAKHNMGGNLPNLFGPSAFPPPFDM